MSTIMRKEVDRVNQGREGRANDGRADDGRADDPLETMHAIVHLYRSRQLRDLRGGPHELAQMEMRALGYFARHPGATQSDLVAHSGRDKAQVARLIRALREARLLEAAPDEHDRRSTRLTLSAAGQEVFAGLQRESGALGAAALAGLSGDEQAQLMALLARVRANLERQRAD
ncbi:DNA-binding MarR family transcriptional regulator [Massilia sp. UYP11]|uniref:MarR family winged helix-turn-helix transcriptional regulator n=1 Tax=Massilia sp. UYP11 TaxID=1756385 RepID=UPI003D1A7710